MKWGLLGLFAALQAGCFPTSGKKGGDTFQRWEDIPAGHFVMGSRAGATRDVDVAPFRMARTETTVAEFMRYLDAAGVDFSSPQFLQRAKRREAGAPSEPVAYVSYDQARAYARWLSAELGCEADLPTEAEWEYAARGGVHGAPFPWGWGEPARRACFRAARPQCVGRFPPNRFGICDLAGNVAEWCRVEEDTSATAPVRGGSWADRSEDLLRVERSVPFPRAYRDADVGFRVVLRSP